MSLTAYATHAQLVAWLSVHGDAPAELSDSTRLRTRASELLDGYVRAPYAVDADTNLPTDSGVADALADACCAQVEYWLTVGEVQDIEGQANRQVSTGGSSFTLGPELAPRAARALGNVGLLTVYPAATQEAVTGR